MEDADLSSLFSPEMATPDQKRAAMVAALRGLQGPQAQAPAAQSPDLIFAMGQNDVTQPLAKEAMQSAHFQALNDQRQGNLGLGIQKLANAAVQGDARTAQGVQRIGIAQQRADDTATHQSNQDAAHAEAAKARAHGGGGPDITDPATQAMIERGAQYYHTTAKMPGGASGKGMEWLRRAIMNREAQLAASEGPGAAPLAQSGAGYAADAASLKKLRTQADAIDAFERTGLANLDTFIAQAHKVKDTGSPWLNKPIRWFDENVAGNPEMAGFNASRQTAVQEIAKILSGQTGGGALSDSARHEVEGLMGPNATLAQLLKAAEILKTDMHNRKLSVGQQLEEMQGRIGGHSAQPHAAAAAVYSPEEIQAAKAWLQTPEAQNSPHRAEVEARVRAGGW